MYQSIEDIKLETIDFDWIKKTTNINHLKRAIRLIQLDGDYFQELKKACQQRMAQIDSKFKLKQQTTYVSPEIKRDIQMQLQQWEKSVEKKGNKEKKIFEEHANLEDHQLYFKKQQNLVQNQKAAEASRVKGNQAIRSKDYDEAISYYTKSLELNPKMYQSYCNRALAYLKKKEFQKCLQDCDMAIRYNSKYTKAYHRKAKAYIGLKNRVEAYKQLQQALKIEPQNSEMNGEIKQLWEELNQEERKLLEGSKNEGEINTQFKRIAIQQDSSDNQDQK